MAQWSDLNQEEKFDIMRDYVRRGFHNLDAIMNDFNEKQAEGFEKKSDPESPYKLNPKYSTILNVFRDWYSDGI